MSIETDFVDFLQPITVNIYTEANTGGVVTKTLASTATIQAIIQSDENSNTNNSQVLDRKLQGKNTRGDVLIMTSNDYNKQLTEFVIEGLTYRIDQKDPVRVIYPHFEYLGVIKT